MSSIIRIKRSESSGNPPILAAGELAYSALTDNGGNGGDRLYIGTGVETAGDAVNHTVIGGKYFTDMMDHIPGSLTASSAIITNSSNKIDRLLIDDLIFDDAEISTGQSNQNLTLSPNGTGSINVNSSRIINLATPTGSNDAATKAYVDGELGNFSSTLAFTGDTGYDTIDLSIGTLQFRSGVGLSVTVTNDRVTTNVNIADSNELGIASFNSTHFTVSSGDVSLKDFTIGSTAMTVGDTLKDVAGLTSLTVDDITMDGNVISTPVGIPLYLDPGSAGNLGDLYIRGNLYVEGEQTIINSTTMSVNDLTLVLADSAETSMAADGAGIVINGANATIEWDAANDRFTSNKGMNLPSFFINGKGITDFIDDRIGYDLFIGGNAITATYDDGAGTLTVGADVAGYNSQGVAAFDSDQMTITSGLVSITEVNGGIY